MSPIKFFCSSLNKNVESYIQKGLLKDPQSIKIELYVTTGTQAFRYQEILDIFSDRDRNWKVILPTAVTSACQKVVEKTGAEPTRPISVYADIFFKIKRHQFQSFYFYELPHEFGSFTSVGVSHPGNEQQIVDYLSIREKALRPEPIAPYLDKEGNFMSTSTAVEILPLPPPVVRSKI